MVDLFLYVGAVLGVLGVFGLPALLVASPPEWRRWWPVSLPIVGLAVLTCVVQPLGTLFPVGDVALPAIALAMIAGAALLARGHRLERPAVLAVVALFAVAPLGAFVYRPSLRLHEPRPSGVRGEDAIYYLVIDQWFEDHTIRSAPPRPDQDGFWATARQGYDNHLRIGVDLANIEVAKVTGSDPLDTFPALTAVLAALAALGVALLLVSMRAPPWAAVLAVVILASRPELVRLGVDSFTAQLAGLALLVPAAAAIFLALLHGGARRIATAALLIAGLIACYVEFAVVLVVMGVAALVALLLTGPPEAATPALAPARRWRTTLLRRGGLLAGAAFLANPLATVNGLRSLSEASSRLSGESIVPFLGPLRSLSIGTGPLSIIRETSEFGLILGVVVAVIAVSGLLALRGHGRVLLFALTAGVLAILLHQSEISPYSYGVYKALSILAPVVAAGLVVALVGTSGAARVAIAVCGVLLLGMNATAQRQISRDAVFGENGLVPGDLALKKFASVVPGVHSVALAGTDLGGAANARQHFGLYLLREEVGLHVTVPRGTGSYFTTDLDRGPADADLTYRPDYERVVSYGPSLTHGAAVAALGHWQIYDRDPVDVLMTGREGWGPALLIDGRPLRYSLGQSFLWLSSPRPARVRLRLELESRGATRPVTVSVGPQRITRLQVDGARTITTPAFTIPAGRSVAVLDSPLVPPSEDPAGAPLGVGVRSVRALPAR